MNILFTCAGRRTYLLKYFRENLSENDSIIATDMQLTAPALQAADVKIQVPPVSDPNYIGNLIAICQKYSVDILISLNDLELPVIASNMSLFKEIGVNPIVSDPEVIDICFDKYKTAIWISRLGLNTPKTFINLGDAKKAIKEGTISYPLFLKPRWGSGSIGLEIAWDEEELVLLYSLLQKKIKRSILSNVSVGEDFILIQEYLSGDEFGLDVINNLQGDYVAVSVKKKLAMRAGETDKAVTIDSRELRLIGESIGRGLRHIGNLDVDIIQRSNGDYCILEMNPRFGGGFPFSYEAGVNLPKVLIEWSRGIQASVSDLIPKPNIIMSKSDCIIRVGDAKSL